ncbi:Uncharacterised protein [Mycolicibacterium aurum]|uniref:DUF6602 domain-containing protein n=1 Tax=Mycolicibacterium aurum TaxID=1791 RepID=A0A3S4VTE2_MYCAU|nr:DUF6602 domain-containing protein [Mycolicibacterium aurum]VEG58181.1 Uncharacterised protein [Mycolicibacterium aurum]
MTSDDAVQHELQEFLAQDRAEIAAEYERIYRRTAEDPGTAGDQGEENWAALLRNWLPPNYQVVTKGRIIFPDKEASPQVDILVLRGTYPPRLVSKKLYLSTGVIAAFECKNTLKAAHFTDATETARWVKSKAAKRYGTPYDELHSLPIYGLLAHSHSWKGVASTPIDNIDKKMLEAVDSVEHPSQLINIVCVADLGTWTLNHFTQVPHLYPAEIQELRAVGGHSPNSGTMTGFCRWGLDNTEQVPGAEPNPVAVLVSDLIERIAWEDRDLRPIADYFRMAGVSATGTILGREYALPHVFSSSVAERLEAMGPTSGLEHLWDPWNMMQ